jgi:hypothetical protein
MSECRAIASATTEAPDVPGPHAERAIASGNKQEPEKGPDRDLTSPRERGQCAASSCRGPVLALRPGQAGMCRSSGRETGRAQGSGVSPGSRYWWGGGEKPFHRLQSDWIDLYQVHRPRTETDVEETLGAPSDLVHQGRSATSGPRPSPPARSSRRSGSCGPATFGGSSPSSRPTRCSSASSTP